jgi:hypothetical protein
LRTEFAASDELGAEVPSAKRKKILEGSTFPSMGMHVTIYKTLQSDVVNVVKHYY